MRNCPQSPPAWMMWLEMKVEQIIRDRKSLGFSDSERPAPKLLPSTFDK